MVIVNNEDVKQLTLSYDDKIASIDDIEAFLAWYNKCTQGLIHQDAEARLEFINKYFENDLARCYLINDMS